MLNEIFKSIPEINVYPLITLILFFTIFILVTIWALRVKKSYIKEMEQMPLDNPEHINNGEN